MMVPMNQPITEQTGKVVVVNNTNQFYQNYELFCIWQMSIKLAGCCLPKVRTCIVSVHTCAAPTGTAQHQDQRQNRKGYTYKSNEQRCEGGWLDISPCRGQWQAGRLLLD